MVILEGQKCYTLQEAAQILQIGVPAVRKSITKGYFTPVIIAGVKHLNETQIKEYDQRRKGRKHDS